MDEFHSRDVYETPVLPLAVVHEEQPECSEHIR